MKKTGDPSFPFDVRYAKHIANESSGRYFSCAINNSKNDDDVPNVDREGKVKKAETCIESATFPGSYGAQRKAITSHQRKQNAAATG